MKVSQAAVKATAKAKQLKLANDGIDMRAAGLPGASQYPEYDPLHGSRAGSFQGLLAGLTPCASACCLLAKPPGVERYRADGQAGAPVLREGQENANIHADLGFIWRILG